MVIRRRELARTVLDRIRIRRRGFRNQLFLFPELDVVPFTPEKAAAVVDTLFAIIKETLAGGEEVRITGFGRFLVRFKWARGGRNPRTGEAIVLRPRKTVVFKPSGRLRDRVSQRERLA